VRAELIDANGRIVRTANLWRHGSQHIGPMRLEDLPDGGYFIRIADKRVTRMLHFVKVD
jgi:hypothetical protein